MFTLESEMIPIIEGSLDWVLGYPQSFARANELPVNNRVVDLAAALVDARQMESVYRLLRALPKLSLQQLDVLSLFGDRDPLSIQYLCRRTFLDAATIHASYVDCFVRTGLVSRCTKFMYATTGWKEALPTCIVAVEVKLARWQQVLEQAVDNLVFADISYAALDIDQFPASRTCLEQFREAGIGVLGVQDKGTVEVIVQPSRNHRGRDRSFQAIRVLRDLQSKHGRTKWRLVH